MPLTEVLDTYAAHPLAYATAFVLGAMFGSFANVCIYRMPEGQSVVSPGSRCGACGAPVRWYDNVPIVSYLLLRGRCRSCGAGFSARYMLVEAATGMLFAFVWHLTMALAWQHEPAEIRVLRFGVYAALVFVLVVITFIDLDHQLILDKITYPSIVLFYALGMALPGAIWWRGLVGAAVGYGVVRLIADGYWYLTGREGMGYGDGKLLAIFGALWGWQAVVVSLFVGSLAGSVIGIGVLIASRGDPEEADEPPAEGGPEPPVDDATEPGELAPEEAVDDDVGEPALRHTALPFGPFLAIGAVVYLFAQPWLRVGFGLLLLGE
jgi:leader peptidase (prepilin peptidase)/N-methyltransferase